ncbi:MAG TPA: lytic transglycosylase domain-containing protein [Saprospiraceae bacterium]|nr:lytic transglycosylase domain-containing protein [Saprospiraceae bacterium]
MKKKEFVLGTFAGMGIVASLLFLLSNMTNNTALSDSNSQTIYGVELEESYQFAGEPMDISQDDIRERLDRELLLNTFQHSATLLHLKLASRYFPMIEDYFKKEQIPDDMKYLAVAESSLRYAVSPSGAKGLWQFLEGTAKDFGLEVNDYVDERNHAEKSTQAACLYLKQLKERFGSWTMAAAAYNMGPTALAKSISEQRETDYYKMNLSEETNRYLFRIVAIKQILNHPEKFGFYLKDEEKYQPFSNTKQIEIKTTIENLGDFAHSFQMSYRKLKLLNPWLLKSSLPNKTGKSYLFTIEKE